MLFYRAEVPASPSATALLIGVVRAGAKLKQERAATLSDAVPEDHHTLISAARHGTPEASYALLAFSHFLLSAAPTARLRDARSL